MLWWGYFEIPTPKTLENMQKNVFSAVLIPDWKFLCRYFTGSAQKRKDILRFQHFPEAFTNVCLFLLRYKLAKQNSLLHRKQTPAKVFPVSFVRKQSKWRHFIKVAGLLLRFCNSLKGNVIQNFQKNVFSGQSLLSYVLSITILKTDSTGNISCAFSDFSKLLGEIL